MARGKTQQKKGTAPKKSVRGPAQVQTAEPSVAAVPTEYTPVDPGQAGQLDSHAAVDALVARLNASFAGRGQLLAGHEFENVFILRRPTGITDIDIALAGGLPAGGLSQFIGKEGSTKTYLANCVIREVQRNYGDEALVGLCMTEIAFDKGFAKRCGVRIAYSEREILSLEAAYVRNGYTPFTEEYKNYLRDQVGKFTHAIYATAEELLEVAVQMVESNLYKVILIDSFGALLTKAEAEAEEGITKKHYGGSAGPVTQFMHRLHAALNTPTPIYETNAKGKQTLVGFRPNTTTIIGINQYRENMDAGMWGNPMRQAGGSALKHGKLVDLFLSQGQRLTTGTEKFIIGKHINWELIKGKAGCHDGPKGTFFFYFGESNTFFGADFYTDLATAAVKAGVVEQSGAWYTYNGHPLGQGKENVVKLFFQDPNAYGTIQRAVFNRTNTNFLVRALWEEPQGTS